MSEPELRQEIEQLRAEARAADEWADGLYSALLDVVAELSRHHPRLADDLKSRWRLSAARFDALSAGHKPDSGCDSIDTPGNLEPRAKLYRALASGESKPPARGS